LESHVVPRNTPREGGMSGQDDPSTCVTCCPLSFYSSVQKLLEPPKRVATFNFYPHARLFPCCRRFSPRAMPMKGAELYTDRVPGPRDISMPSSNGALSTQLAVGTRFGYWCFTLVLYTNRLKVYRRGKPLVYSTRDSLGRLWGDSRKLQLPNAVRH